MKPKSIIAFATALTLLGQPAVAQTIILARHGEKVDASADPLLSEAGQARAQALAAAVVQARLTHVFSTPLQRTRGTAAPAAQAADLEIQTLSLDGGGAAHIARTASILRALGPDDTALVVGHSNTIPEIARALGLTDTAAMSDCEYDRLIVVRLKADGAAQAVTGRYGAPTQPC